LITRSKSVVCRKFFTDLPTAIGISIEPRREASLEWEGAEGLFKERQGGDEFCL
jgi:hypothetical protein